MKLTETVAMMNSENYKERFRAEYWQLKIRMTGLIETLVKYKKGTLPFTPKSSYDLLNAQLKAMDLYASFLEDRAQVEGIDLDLDEPIGRDLNGN